MAKKSTKDKGTKKKRTKPEAVELPTSYFIEDKTELTFSTGSTVLDCALGGGWPLRRMFNVVGDKSTGKTLLMIEACANFVAKYKGECVIHYIEVEAAFDKAYAAALGMPIDKVRFTSEEEEVYTIEQLENILIRIVDGAELPTLVLVDSYDALSDSAEIGREGDAKTYGMEKAKAGSRMFRKVNQKMAHSRVTLGIVSQVRSKVDAGSFGKKTQRCGGKALDFYATHVVWLAHLGRLTRERQKIKRPYGVSIEANVEKNKIALPFRKATFPIHFGFGIEDCTSMIDWLAEHNGLQLVFDGNKTEATKEAKSLRQGLEKLEPDEYRKWSKKLRRATKQRWREIEALFISTRSKYAN